MILTRAETGVRLLAASILAMLLGVVAGSIVLLLVSAVLGWIAVSHLLPGGGVTAPLAVAVLWSNAAVLVAADLGAPPQVGLLPQVLLAALVVGRVYVHQRGVVSTPAFRALLLHGVALTVAGLAALDSAPVVGSLQTFLIEGPILWFLVINAIDDRARLERAMAAMVVASALLGGLSLLQYATDTYDNDYLGFAQVDENRIVLLQSDVGASPRLSGPLGEQNRYAQMLLVVVPVGIALSRRRGLRAVLYSSAVLMIVTGIVLTASRGAALSLGVTFVTMVALRLVKRRAVVVVAVIALVGLVALPSYRDRVTSSFDALSGIDGTEEVDGSTLSRITENVAAVHMLNEHLVTGVGPDGYPGQYERYAERIGLNVKDEARRPHNLYLGIAAELGLVGLSTFLAVVGFVVVRLVRAWTAARDDPRLAAIAAGFLAAIVAYLFSGIFLHLAFERYLWMLLALADAAARIVIREASTAHGSGEEAVPVPGGAVA